MTSTSPPVVLIVTEVTADAARWRQILEAANFEVHMGADKDSHADVVLSDRSFASASARLDRGANESNQPGRILIADGVGDSLEADARLAPDFAPHELVSTCGLVAQIARLRRQLQDGEQARGLLWQQAQTDPLTQLPNRRAWDEQLAARASSPSGTNRSLCLVVFDLDHFKHVNDRFGHLAGDAVLQQTGIALRRALRQEDFWARLGGDEFAALLIGEDVDHFADMVQRVRLSVAQELQAHDSLPRELRPVTASAGYAVCRDSASFDPQLAMRTADAALLRAKESGRDCAVGQHVSHDVQDASAESSANPE